MEEDRKGNNGNQQGNNGEGPKEIMGISKETTEEGPKEIMGTSKETTEEYPKEIIGINKVTMVGDLKGNNGNQQGDNGRGSQKENVETSKEIMVGDLNKRIEATSKGMKRRINRNIEVGDSF